MQLFSQKQKAALWGTVSITAGLKHAVSRLNTRLNLCGLHEEYCRLRRSEETSHIPRKILVRLVWCPILTS